MVNIVQHYLDFNYTPAIMIPLSSQQKLVADFRREMEVPEVTVEREPTRSLSLSDLLVTL